MLLHVHRPVGLLGTGAQNVHLDFHTAPVLCVGLSGETVLLKTLKSNTAIQECQLQNTLHQTDCLTAIVCLVSVIKLTFITEAADNV